MKHQEDDPFPSVNKEKLILYMQRFCPFCMRVNIILNYHGIEHEIVYISLTSKPDWFLQMNPQGKVPFIEKDGQKMGDSEMICAFLDQLKPGESLSTPNSEPFVSKVTTFVGKNFRALHDVLFDKEVSPESRKTFLEGMKEVEKVIVGPFVAGDQMSMADILIYPMMSYTSAAYTLIGEAVPTATQLPKLHAFLAAMSAVPAVAKVTNHTDLVIRFAKTYKTGTQDPNID